MSNANNNNGSSPIAGIIGRPRTAQDAYPDEEMIAAQRAMQPRSQPINTPVQQPVPPKRGRPKVGKRSNPDYVQTSIYIHKELHEQMQVALIQRKVDGDLSDITNWLYQKWLKGEVRGNS